MLLYMHKIKKKILKIQSGQLIILGLIELGDCSYLCIDIITEELIISTEIYTSNNGKRLRHVTPPQGFSIVQHTLLESYMPKNHLKTTLYLSNQVSTLHQEPGSSPRNVQQLSRAAVHQMALRHSHPYRIADILHM
jgi:hypothetical protein